MEIDALDAATKRYIKRNRDHIINSVLDRGGVLRVEWIAVWQRCDACLDEDDPCRECVARRAAYVLRRGDE